MRHCRRTVLSTAHRRHRKEYKQHRAAIELCAGFSQIRLTAVLESRREQLTVDGGRSSLADFQGMSFARSFSVQIPQQRGKGFLSQLRRLSSTSVPTDLQAAAQIPIHSQTLFCVIYQHESRSVLLQWTSQAFPVKTWSENR